jgi:hypothetical protein
MVPQCAGRATEVPPNLSTVQCFKARKYLPRAGLGTLTEQWRAVQSAGRYATGLQYSVLHRLPGIRPAGRQKKRRLDFRS